VCQRFRIIMCLFWGRFYKAARVFNWASHNTYIWIILPELVSLGSMAGVQDHILTCIVQACLISSYFTCLAHHPVLKPITIIQEYKQTNDMINTVFNSLSLNDLASETNKTSLQSSCFTLSIMTSGQNIICHGNYRNIC